MGSLFFGYWPTLFPFSHTHSHTWHLIPDWWLMTPEVFQRGPPRVKITCHKYRSSKIPFSRHSSICTCCSIVCVCVYTCACEHRCARARNLDLWLWKHLKMCTHLPASKHPLPLLFLSPVILVHVWRVWRKWGELLQQHLPKCRTIPAILSWNSSLLFPRSSLSPVQQTEDLPQLSSNLHRELFPRVETLSSFFSPLSPLPPFYQCQMITPGGNWARQQYASGEPKGV